ncbi:MAG: hypothetical protein KJZ91_14305 [Myxococcales bacterium]|nr:hypothetical protein [Myxococcales bacterium]
MAVVLFGALVGGSGCPRGGGGGPRPPAAEGWALGANVLGADPLGGVAAVGADADAVIVTDGARARRLGRDGAVGWERPLGADLAAGAVAVAGDLALVAVGGTGGAVGGTGGAVGGTGGGAVGGTGGGAVGGTGAVLRGAPGAALVALGVGDGGVRWTVGAGSTRWTLIAQVVADGDGFLVAGSFAGTLRLGDRTVTAAGGSDGFVAALDAGGGVRWLRRMGGDGGDGVRGVAALGAGRVAIAGTFTGPAELADGELVALADRTLAADGFVAVLEADGRLAWSRTFGGAREDTCAGVAVLADGAIAVAGTVRGEVDVAGRRLEARGGADGLVAVFAPDATVRAAWLVGGDDFDGLTAIGAVGAELVVTGWWTGALPSGERADGVDDLLVAVAPPAGPPRLSPVRSSGAASATAFATTAAGWLLATHGAAPVRNDGVERPAGAALWFRAP